MKTFDQWVQFFVEKAPATFPAHVRTLIAEAGGVTKLEDAMLLIRACAMAAHESDVRDDLGRMAANPATAMRSTATTPGHDDTTSPERRAVVRSALAAIEHGQRLNPFESAALLVAVKRVAVLSDKWEAEAANFERFDMVGAATAKTIRDDARNLRAALSDEGLTA